MELEALQQKLIDLFVEMQDYRQFFKRKLYADAFMKCWEKNRELVAALSEACEQAEDGEDGGGAGRRYPGLRPQADRGGKEQE